MSNLIWIRHLVKRVSIRLVRNIKRTKIKRHSRRLGNEYTLYIWYSVICVTQFCMIRGPLDTRQPSDWENININAKLHLLLREQMSRDKIQSVISASMRCNWITVLRTMLYAWRLVNVFNCWVYLVQNLSDPHLPEAFFSLFQLHTPQMCIKCVNLNPDGFGFFVLWQ